MVSFILSRLEALKIPARALVRVDNITDRMSLSLNTLGTVWYIIIII